jgi:hypothetical protein
VVRSAGVVEAQARRRCSKEMRQDGSASFSRGYLIVSNQLCNGSDSLPRPLSDSIASTWERTSSERTGATTQRQDGYAAASVERKQMDSARYPMASPGMR